MHLTDVNLDLYVDPEALKLGERNNMNPPATPGIGVRWQLLAEIVLV